MTLVQQAGGPLFSCSSRYLCSVPVPLRLSFGSEVFQEKVKPVRVFHRAALVMQTTVAVIVLHGVVSAAGKLLSAALPSLVRIGFLLFSEQSCDSWTRDVMLPSKWRLLGPTREHGRHADVWRIHRTTIRGRHSSDRQRATAALPLRSEPVSADHTGL